MLFFLSTSVYKQMHPKHCHSFNQNPCFQSFNSPYFLSFLCLTLMPQSWDQWRSDALLFKSEFQVEMWRSLALPRFGSFITVTCHSTGNLRPTSHASVTRSGFLPKVWLYCIYVYGYTPNIMAGKMAIGSPKVAYHVFSFLLLACVVLSSHWSEPNNCS